MQAVITPTGTLTVSVALGEPEQIDSRQTRDEAYVAAAVYERLMGKHGLTHLYTVKVEHTGYMQWAICLVLNAADESLSEPGHGV